VSISPVAMAARYAADGWSDEEAAAHFAVDVDELRTFMTGPDYNEARDEASRLLDAWPIDPPAEPEEPLYADVAALLAGGIPPPPEPVLLRRSDGHALFYAAKVNVVFGDPESGKTWIALAAAVEALNAGRKAVFVDLDHNGVSEVVSRLLMLGARKEDLGNLDRFRYCEPEDGDQLVLTVADLRRWRPAVAIVDSIGELLPILGLSSNSPDDYTSANRRVLSALATCGAAVIAVDHLPKDDTAREKGQTGTLAKRRTVNGITLRVTVAEPFAPGHGGAASMTVTKDRPGGVRAHCPMIGKSQPAGRFVMEARDDGTVSWHVTAPRELPADAPDADVAELDALAPPPRSQRDVQERLKWGSNRALNALRRWRDLQKPSEVGDPA
jgi:hypothetical protein